MNQVSSAPCRECPGGVKPAVSAFPPRRLYHGIERGLGLAAAVEQQGIVGPAGDGPVVAPGLAVVDAPERDAAEFIPMLSEKRK